MDFNHLFKTILIFGISIFLSNTYAETSHNAIVCEQPYALCTSAPCIPDPKNPGKSICDCVVQQGKSAGFTACEKRKPSIDHYKVTHLISTFSFEQFASKKALTCPKGMPWSNCVDMPCTTDPRNTNHAICICELNATQEFFTFGGNCETHACTSGFWSGAVQGPASIALREALNKVVSNPAPPVICPTNSSH
jgi:hypothetical protein